MYSFLFSQDSNFITALELAVRFGKTLIIQEMDGVEPVLYPLLRRDLVAQGKHLTLCRVTIFRISTVSNFIAHLDLCRSCR